MKVIRRISNDPYCKEAVITTLDIIAYMKKLNKKQVVLTGKEVIFSFSVSMSLPRTTCLLDSLNKYLSIFLTNGLIDYWMNNNEVFNSQRIPVSKEPKQLGNGSLTFGYQLLGIGLLFSAILFIMELFSSRFETLKAFFHYLG